MSLAIGIDVGGTKIAAGILDLTTGAIVERHLQPSKPERGGEAVLNDVLSIAKRFSPQAKSIGVGLAELVSADGEILSEATFAWKKLAVRERLNKILPTRLDADVRAAARAEAKWGAGKNFANFVYVTIGTGISCALVLEGKPYLGSRGIPGTFASSPALVPLQNRTVGETLALEEFASGKALEKTQTHNASGRVAGSAIAHLVNTLDPGAVIIGGGLGCARGDYFEALRSEFYERLWSPLHREVQILQATLGADAGWIGAALL